MRASNTWLDAIEAYDACDAYIRRESCWCFTSADKDLKGRQAAVEVFAVMIVGDKRRFLEVLLRF